MQQGDIIYLCLIGVADAWGNHHRAFNLRVFNCKVTDFCICRASEQSQRIIFRLLNDQIGNRMAVAVEGSRESIFRIRQLCLFFTLARRNKCADRQPFRAFQVDVCSQYIMS